MSWERRFDKLRVELGMHEETLQARLKESHLHSFRAFVRWSIEEEEELRRAG
jgi:hypothetical protein